MSVELVPVSRRPLPLLMMKPNVWPTGRLSSNKNVPSGQIWRIRPTEQTEEGQLMSLTPRLPGKDLRNKQVGRLWWAGLSIRVEKRSVCLTVQQLVYSSQNDLSSSSAPKMTFLTGKVAFPAEQTGNRLFCFLSVLFPVYIYISIYI